jgi:hypothetical protein
MVNSKEFTAKNKYAKEKGEKEKTLRLHLHCTAGASVRLGGENGLFSAESIYIGEKE